MFEAFEVSTPRHRGAPPEAVPAAPEPQVAARELPDELFQTPLPVPPRSLVPDNLPPPPPETGFSLPFSGATFAVGAAVALALAYALGVLSARESSTTGERGSAEVSAEVSAEAPAEPQPRSAPNTPPARPERAATPAVPREAPPVSRGPAATQPAAEAAADDATRAFLDPRNQFTLQLVSYDGSPNGRSLAEHWLGVLRGRGLPAVLRQVGTKLSLFVGASPNSLEIEELGRRVLEVRDSRDKPVFPSPRVVSLADFR